MTGVQRALGRCLLFHRSLIETDFITTLKMYVCVWCVLKEEKKKKRGALHEGVVKWERVGFPGGGVVSLIS